MTMNNQKDIKASVMRPLWAGIIMKPKTRGAAILEKNQQKSTMN